MPVCGRSSKGTRPGQGGIGAMTITEIAATGLLRVMVPAGPDVSRSELPDGATRAIALAALQSTTGVRGAVPELPSQSMTGPARNTRSRQGKRARSGDYSAEAQARKGRRARDADDEEGASTFSAVL